MPVTRRKPNSTSHSFLFEAANCDVDERIGRSERKKRPFTRILTYWKYSGLGNGWHLGIVCGRQYKKYAAEITVFRFQRNHRRWWMRLPTKMTILRFINTTCIWLYPQYQQQSGTHYTCKQKKTTKQLHFVHDNPTRERQLRCFGSVPSSSVGTPYGSARGRLGK